MAISRDTFAAYRTNEGSYLFRWRLGWNDSSYHWFAAEILRKAGGYRTDRCTNCERNDCYGCADGKRSHLHRSTLRPSDIGGTRGPDVTGGRGINRFNKGIILIDLCP